MLELTWLIWAILAIAGFAWRPGPAAACLILVTGWILLPNVDYHAYRDAGQIDRWFNVRGLALAGPVFLTKASVVGAVTLLAIAAFDRQALARIKPHWLDIPILAWCAIPLASGLANAQPPASLAADTLSHALAWLGPYLVGRAYLADHAGRTAAARVLIVAGIAYIPLVLIEWLHKPIVYTALYGFHPHQHDGAHRLLGFRGPALLEHGNALGIWLASLAVLAVAACRTGILTTPAAPRGNVVIPRVNARRPLAVTLALLAAAIVTQSVGPIALMLVALAILAAARHLRTAVILAILIAPALGYVAFRIADPPPLRPALESIAGERFVNHLRRLEPARSLAWRIEREEEHIARVRQRPILGHAAFNWWQGEHDAPWSLWMLTLGRYGTLGTLSLIALFAIPLAHFLYQHPPTTWHNQPQLQLQAAFALVLAMSLIDNMLNNTFNLPLLITIGALIPHNPHASPS